MRPAASRFTSCPPARSRSRGYAETVASWFGQEARLSFLPFEEWRAAASEEDAAATWSHLAHSPCASIEAARAAFGYSPRFSSLEAVREALAWLLAAGLVDTAGRRLDGAATAPR